MSNALAIIFRATASATASGQSDVFDLGVRTYTEARLDITAISSATLTVTLETSPTQSSWTPIAYFKPQTAQGTVDIVVPSGERYMRARWVVTGTSPSVTFSLTATARQLYIQRKDLVAYGLPPSALANLSEADIARACLNASEEADGYLANSYTLPMASLDGASRKHIANMIMFELTRFRPAVASESVRGDTEIGRSEALKWFGGVAAGKLAPPGLVDATPDVNDSTTGAAGGGIAGPVFVISNPVRGWGD